MRGSCLVPSQLFHTKRVVSKILKAQVNSELPCTVCCPWVRWECRCWVCWVEMMTKNAVHVIEIPCNVWISLGHVAPFLTSFLYWSYSGDWTCKYCCSLSLTSTFILLCTLQKAVGDSEVFYQGHQLNTWKTILQAKLLEKFQISSVFCQITSVIISPAMIFTDSLVWRNDLVLSEVEVLKCMFFCTCKRGR